MDKRTHETEIFDEAQADVRVEGMPSWANRELKPVFAEDIKRSPGIDKPFLLITILLLLIGLIMMLSASFASANIMTGEPLRLFQNQAIFAVSGVALMLIVSRVSVNFIRRCSLQVLIVSIALLVLVLIIGIRINGATRWLGVGGEDDTLFSFQPSEITKLAVILAFARLATRLGRKRMKTVKYGIIPFAAITVTILILLYRQPHVSAMVIIGAVAAVMMFAGGTRIRYFLFGVVGAALLAAVVLLPTLINSVRESGVQGIVQETSSPEFDFSGMGHWGRRIEIWLDPNADPLGGGFQTRQSLNAVGSGGWLGQGLGQSRQKHHYLPEEHNDFIFAVIAEELGFVGAMMILSLFALLIVRGYWIAIHAVNRYSALIVIGITSLLALQVFFNVAVVTNIIPATGISLPMFSYGGTALWMQLIQMGIVLAVSREIPLAKAEVYSDDEQEPKV